MPRQYIIEHGTENNRWLCKIEQPGTKDQHGALTNTYGPRVENAVVFTNEAKAVAFAKKWRGRVWQIRNGKPETQVWPETGA